MAHARAFYSKGKTTYYIDGQRFTNSSQGKRDGKEKAVNYCLEHFIDPNKIIRFDSNLECNYYEYLLDLEKQGKISNLSTHFTLLVQKEFYNANGDLIPAITYCADFVYKDLETNKRVVVDVKGASLFQDTRFLIEKQLFDNVFKEKGLYIKVVLWRDKNWVEWKIGDKKKPRKLIKKQSETIKQLIKEKHDREVAERKKEREIARMKELKAKPKLTSVEKKRLLELQSRYEN